MKSNLYENFYRYNIIINIFEASYPKKDIKNIKYNKRYPLKMLPEKTYSIKCKNGIFMMIDFIENELYN